MCQKKGVLFVVALLLCVVLAGGFVSAEEINVSFTNETFWVYEYNEILFDKTLNETQGWLRVNTSVNTSIDASSFEEGISEFGPGYTGVVLDDDFNMSVGVNLTNTSASLESNSNMSEVGIRVGNGTESGEQVHYFCDVNLYSDGNYDLQAESEIQHNETNSSAMNFSSVNISSGAGTLNVTYDASENKSYCSFAGESVNVTLNISGRGNFDVGAELDEYGNITANFTSFTASGNFTEFREVRLLYDFHETGSRNQMKPLA